MGPGWDSFVVHSASQIIFVKPPKAEWTNTLFIPLYAAAASLVALAANFLLISRKKEGDGGNIAATASDELQPGVIGILYRHAKRFGGETIFSFKIARLLTCLTLLSLSITSSMRKGVHHGDISAYLDRLAIPATYLYTSILATFALSSPRWTSVATRHITFILVVTFGVYAYRDLWQLATTDKTPADIQEGGLLWGQVVVLGIAALIIPLFTPRQYVPVDPQNPMEDPNLEQTASLFSLIFYFFLDPIIFAASKVAHLPFDQLPPLGDADRAKYRTSINFPYMDRFRGAKKQHLFWGILRAFRMDFINGSISAATEVILGFASPFAVNRILKQVYLETMGQGTTIRPWLWIIVLFFGPLFSSLAAEWYCFIVGRLIVRNEGLLTQLIFEHSLRIRMKAEASKEEAPMIAESAVVASSAESEESSETSAQSDDDTLAVTGDGDGATAGTNQTSGDAKPTGSDSGAAKGKGKLDAAISTNIPAAAGEKKKSDNFVGKLNNLVTSDIASITRSADVLLLVLEVPLQLCIGTLFLYKVLGWSAFVGIASILVMLPVPGYGMSMMQSVQRAKMQKSDARVQAVTETINVARMVKLFGWEHEMSKRIDMQRQEELTSVWKLKLLQTLITVINFMISASTMLVTYGTYTIIMKQQLSASKVFSSMPIFSMLRMALARVSASFNTAIQAKVALDRVNNFLHDTELLDTFEEKPSKLQETLTPDDVGNEIIGFKDAEFAWTSELVDDSVSPSASSYRLRVKGDLFFKPRAINLIIGPTGSGKTSMLMALLGEMHFIPSSMGSWFNLPKAGGVAYAAQESWIQNDTIRNNIVFGSEFHEDRYKKVIRQCALDRDIELFEAGDQTEVGERGLTLSGGQKARVTLARAIYSSANLILLDDVLAALDVHTAKWIVNECLKGDLVKGRTVILVTHNIALASPLADFIVSIGVDGRIHSQGTDISAALEKDEILAEEARREMEELKQETKAVDPPTKESKPNGKLIAAEEVAKGHVGWNAMKLYLTGLGGTYPLLFFTVCTGATLFAHATMTLQVWYLGYWGSQYETRDPADVNDATYLGTYTGMLLVMMTVYCASYLYYNFGSLRASRLIHKKLVDSILVSSLRWLDETPVSRIITRCTQDISAVDGPIAFYIYSLIELLISGSLELGSIVLFTPIFLIPGICFTSIGVYAANVYLKAQLSVKRELSNAKSPLLAHVGSSIGGIVSIRAFDAQTAFITESLKRIDHYSRVARASYNLNRWLAIRMSLMGNVFTSALAVFLVYRRSVSSANSGFSLNMAVEFCGMIIWGVRMYNNFEVEANSLERIQGYIDIEHEPSPTENGKPPAAWPSSGDLVAERLSARYSQNGPKVLHDISFVIKSGERIGIVGRTGSGKSSLTLALLRCIPTEGLVYYDGIQTDQINLDALRSHITIIPQSPELLSGTLRRNLDPFEEHDDAALNDALRQSGLFNLQTNMGEGKLTLDSTISSGGGNLSVGQRQIIALARAIVRKSKVLILDEATSAIDYKTDAIIQDTLRNELGSNVTVITVAHRLQTIMDADKIMVLNEGRLAEFDRPKLLLQKEGSKFKSLVDESGDRVKLYEMAGKKASA